MGKKRGWGLALLACGLCSLVVACVALQSTTAAVDGPFDAGAVFNLPADSPAPPAAPVKLIFIHHSTGENWLNDSDGGLGIALRDNNYFVSDTNYGWGPDSIGDRTDIGHWYDWFVGADAATYTAALYAEYDQNSSYSRLATDPGGPNEIVMFKSCFPNSHIGGNPGDPPTVGDNPLRGEAYDSEYHTVANIKGIYNDLLTYFANHQEKLFVVITAPPLRGSDTDAARAANARAVNNWLVNDWLDGYPHDNVAVFDFYNVLTSNGGNANTNDLGAETGNHHRWWNSAVQHIQTVANNYTSYPTGDSHPSAAGNQKAAAEFVPLLNVFYNRWQGGTACVGLTDVAITGPTRGYTDTLYAFTAVITPANASIPITYTWTPAPASGKGDATARYTWPMTGAKTITLSAQNCGESDSDTHDIAIVPRPVMSHFVYMPLALRNYSAALPSGALIQPGDLTYLGAFRLPDDGERPTTFEYGGNAMTFNPDNNTLFITGHDRIAYGELPDGDQIAEVSIPTPVNSRDIEDLPIAEFAQGFHNPTSGYFTNLEDIPKVGMQYLNHAATGPLLHLSWGQHIQPQNEPSHAWFSPNLAAPDLHGVWFIGYQNLYSTNGYMFDIPTAWADTHANGRYLGTGRMRDGGQGGMGPTLFAYRPWLAGGAAPVSGAHLGETTLLLYENAEATEEITRCLTGYQHPDEWEGGAWLTTPSGKSAVLFAGTKSTGVKYWYGYINPAGPTLPCVDAHVTDFPTCRLADGSLCPAGDMTGCCDEEVGTCVSLRGWWSTRFDAQFILYDPAQLAQVATGQLEAWQPQPYAVVDIDARLYLVPPEWDEVNLGWGDQRRMRIGDATFDRQNGLLYVLELYADGAKPVAHVWRVQ